MPPLFQIGNPQRNGARSAKEQPAKRFVALPATPTSEAVYMRKQHLLTLTKTLDVEDMVWYFEIVFFWFFFFFGHKPTLIPPGLPFSILARLGRSQTFPVKPWSADDTDIADIPGRHRQKPLVFSTRSTHNRKHASQPYGSFPSLLAYILPDTFLASQRDADLSVIDF